MATTRKSRIAKGIALLDEKRPGWCEKINLETLDLSNGMMCVIGQIEGDYNPTAIDHRLSAMSAQVEYGCHDAGAGG